MSFNSSTFLHSSGRLLSNIRPWLSQAAPRTASALLLAACLLLQGQVLLAQSNGEATENLRATLQANGQSILLQWWGKAGRTYFVQTSPNLNLSVEWSYEGHVLTGTGTLSSISLPAQPSPSFIRLRYTDQPMTGDPYEADPDQDGLSNREEIQTHGTNPLDSDSDDDGMPDGWEVQYGLDPQSAGGVDGAQGDADGDTLKNLLEYQLGTSPINADTDGDVLPDWWEFRNQTSLISNLGQDGPTGDIDHDGYTNLEEYRVLSDPRNALSYPGSSGPRQEFGGTGTNTPDPSFAAFLAYRGRWLSFRSVLTIHYPYTMENIYYERELPNPNPPPLNDGFNGDADPNENLKDPGDPRDIPDWRPTYWFECDEGSPGAVKRIGTEIDYFYPGWLACWTWEEFQESIYTVETAYPGEGGKLEVEDTNLDFSRFSALAAMESLPMYQGDPENGWMGYGRRPKTGATVTSQWNIPFEGVETRACEGDYGLVEEQSWPYKYSKAYMDQIQMRYQCNQPAPAALTQSFVLVKRETALSETFGGTPVGPETVTVLGSMELRIEEGQMISSQASANFPLPEDVSLQGGTILLTSPPVAPGNRASYDLLPVELETQTFVSQPGNRERKKIGIGESVLLQVTSPADAQVEWSVVSPGKGDVSLVAQGVGRFDAGEKKEKVKVRAKLTNYGNATVDTEFEVVTPETIYFEKDLDSSGAASNSSDVLFGAYFYFGPDDVSFHNVKGGESAAPPNATGYFNQAPFNGYNHPYWVGGPPNGGNLTRTVVAGKGTKSETADRIQLGAVPPYSSGHFHWDINWLYQLPGHPTTAAGIEFTTVKQWCDLTLTPGNPSTIKIEGGKGPGNGKGAGSATTGPHTANLP